MNDTEPMPTVTASPGREPRRRFVMPGFSLPSRTNAIVVAVASTMTIVAILFAAYTHAEVVALRAEVHEARAAAKTATLAADRATTAADAAQSALASAEAPPTDEQQPDPQQSDQEQPDSQPTDDGSSP